MTIELAINLMDLDLKCSSELRVMKADLLSFIESSVVVVWGCEFDLENCAENFDFSRTF